MAKKEKEGDSSLRIAETTLKEFNRQKRKNTADEFLAAMLNYFDVTGIKPEDVDSRLLTIFSKGIERIIKIQKAQEKDIFRPIKNDLQEVLREKKAKVDLQSFSQEIGLDRDLTKDDFMAIAEKLTEAEKDKLTLNAKISELKEQLDNVKSNPEIKNLSVIGECVDKIFEYLQSKSYDRIPAYLNRIKDTIK